MAEVDEVLGEEHVQHREEQVRVAARLDEEMFVGDRRGLGAARVHDDEPAATFAQLREAAGEIRRGHQAAVRRERIGAEHQQEVGVVDVGNRNRERRAEHQRRRDHLGKLVDARRREAPARTERAQEERDVEQRGVVVRVGIADVRRDRVGAVGVADRAQPGRDQLEGLLPLRFAERRAFADQRAAQAVGIFLQALQAVRLRTDVAAREGVLGIAAHGADAVAFEFDGDAAVRLAERAGAVDGARSRCGAGGQGWRLLRGGRGEPTASTRRTR